VLSGYWLPDRAHVHAVGAAASRAGDGEVMSRAWHAHDCLAVVTGERRT
jgi:hypothetical protein